MRTSQFKLAVFTALIAVFCLPLVASAKINAQKGKEYKLTKKHGPWMIMVASFSLPEKQFRSKEGLTPKEAANELVYELRKKGIPAYTYSTEYKIDRTSTFNRSGQTTRRVLRANKGGVCVLAGNYKSNKDVVGRKTLKWIENNFTPKLLSNVQSTDGTTNKLKNGGVFKSTGGSPLKGAFLTTNPMLTQQEVNNNRVDPLLTKLNPSGKSSIRNNKGKFTLIVASFYGKSATSVGKSGLERAKSFFDKGSDLDTAGSEAWLLANHMRDNGLDAYVYHDRYKSVVTVGQFNDPNQKVIQAEAKRFGAKMRWNPHENKRVLTAEGITLPFRPTANNPVKKKWIFDPQPRLMAVPNI